MIDRTHPLPVRWQCQLLNLARSTAYYHPTPVSEPVLVLMRRIDELHLAHPFAGARMLRDLLRQEGQMIGRRRVATLMRRMGLEALYRKPRTSHRHPAHTIYPYLLRELTIRRPYEEVYLHAYETIAAAHQGLTQYLTFYNQTRPHQALDGKTPDQVYSANLARRLTAA